MKLKLYSTIFVFLFVWLCSNDIVLAQDTTVSLAFKKNRVAATYPLFYAPDLSYQLRQQFQLMKMANSGDPLAQHELGLRYLQGYDLPSDTVKAAEWISKAAAQELPAACYNYGILLMNGWGVSWNPFEAFKNFRIAAEAGMPQAQYITGIIYSENLIVKKDMKAALEWLNKAKNKDFEPASEVLSELARNDDTTSSKLKSKNINDNNSPLVFIDFDFDTSSAKEIKESDLLEALPLSGNESLINSITAPDSQLSLDNIDLKILEETAETGSPEALVMTGYFYEHGKHFTKNLIRAGYYYYRAAKLESRSGAYLLYKLNNTFQLYKDLEKKVKEDDPEAMFLLYGLKSLSFTDVISEEASKDLLFKAASAGLKSAVVESAVNIYSGRYPEYSEDKGIGILRTEAFNNNEIAEQRLISIMIIDSSSITAENLEFLFEASESGSILAETLLGYCYKQGIGVKQDYGTAVKYFRRSAQRGSVFAFEQLKSLHDILRPEEDIFSIQ